MFRVAQVFAQLGVQAADVGVDGDLAVELFFRPELLLQPGELEAGLADAAITLQKVGEGFGLAMKSQGTDLPFFSSA